MAENSKVFSFRADEETIAKFKEISETFPNGAECIKSLINGFELEQSKGALSGMTTDITDYQNHIDSIVSAYLHSLELNQNAENRIRAEFRERLDSNSKTIIDLQERLAAANEQAVQAEEKIQQLSQDINSSSEQATAEIEQLKEKLTAASKTVEQLESGISDKQKIIDNLNMQLINFNEMSEKFKTLEQERTNAVSEKKIAEEKTKEIEKTYKEKIKELEKTIADEKAKAEQNALIANERAANEMEKAVLKAERAAQDRISKLFEEKEKQADKIAKLHEEIAALKAENVELKIDKK